MRLLNSSTLELREFVKDIPSYAILSHTWEEDEVIFQDLQLVETAKQKKGYKKIEKACEHASKYGFQWVWIDTCCIDKQSSAELSEAINSMYTYYKHSGVCYAYLGDARNNEDPRADSSTFRRSRWFTRGWTLQELLAPCHVEFLDKNWFFIGTKASLYDVIAVITGIPAKMFLTGGDIGSAQVSIAQKMSWAAFRETTREEDKAYSLLGLFGVNMPPIYGEGGANAFLRLQQEIIKHSNDRSIFAWIASPSSAVADPYRVSRGIFARSPSEFRASGEVMMSSFDNLGRRSSYTLTNDGLQIHLPLKYCGKDGFLAYLHCRSQRTGEDLAIYLTPITDHQFVRIRPTPEELVLTKWNHSITSDTLQEVFVTEEAPKHPVMTASKQISSVIFTIRHLSSARHFSFVRPRRCGSSLSIYPSTNGEGELVFGCMGADAFEYRVAGLKEESFILVAGFESDAVFANIRTGPKYDMIQYPFYMSEERDYRFAGRTLQPLESGDIVLLVMRVGRGPVSDVMGNPIKNIVLELGIVSTEKTYIPKTNVLQYTDSGFMVQKSPSIRLKQVYPFDPSQKMDSEDVFFVSIDSKHKYRLLLCNNFVKNGRVSYIVVLGIEDGKTWIDVIVGANASKQRLESAWKIYNQHEPDATRNLPHEKEVPLTFDNVVEKSESATSGKISLKERYPGSMPLETKKIPMPSIRASRCLKVTTGRRTGLQLGSHWAKIELVEVRMKKEGE